MVIALAVDAETSAYLNSKLEDEVFMEVPKFVKEALKTIIENEKGDSGNKVWLLKKSLCNRCWYKKLIATFKDFGIKSDILPMKWIEKISKWNFYVSEKVHTHLYQRRYSGTIYYFGRKTLQINLN